MTRLVMRSLGAAATVLLSTGAVGADGYVGEVRIGYVYVDEDGHRGVHQPTFNSYEGLSLSLRDFRYDFEDGTILSADLRDLTLNNRNLFARALRPGRYGLTLRTQQYRRTYNFAGEQFTRRHESGGDLWVKPHADLRLFGGYGSTGRSGTFREASTVDPLAAATAVDYTHAQFHGGVQYTRDQSSIQAEFRGSEYTDQLGADDRNSIRYRISASSQLPPYRKAWLQAGFQHFENRVLERGDTLTANTAWGGARLFWGDGFSGRYSLAWDRSRRTGDVAATDQIVQSLTLGKVWRGRGGLSLGYRHAVRDDAFDARITNGVHASGWAVPVPRLTLRADVGSSRTEDQDGTTLTGDRDLTRVAGSATYRHRYGRLRLAADSRSRQDRDIGSRIDFERAGVDWRLADSRYGELSGAYHYVTGEYVNAQGSFRLADHIVSGHALSAPVRGLQAGFGGSYLRSRKDLDIERFSLSFTGRYRLLPRYTLAVTYTAHNFDDFQNAQQAALYSQYYTANIVEFSLNTELGR